MRRKLILFLLLLPLVATAQVKFGYIAYNEVCVQMPQYGEAQRQLAELKKKYDAEATRSETEFQRKFSEFLQGQKDFPANILVKRQAELQDVMERAVAFRQEAQQLLKDAEQSMLKDVYTKMNEAITAVALERGYIVVLNTDNNNTPFINNVVGEDATDYVRYKLGIITELPASLQTPVPTEKPNDTTPVTTEKPNDTTPVATETKDDSTPTPTESNE